VRKIEDQAILRQTGASAHAVGADGRLALKVKVAGNGVSFLVLESDPAPERRP
jgi:hypothetical protein